MKTLTIKQEVIYSLDSNEKKLEFANSIINLLSGSEKTTDSKIHEVLNTGLNTDIPEPMEGAPDFDPINMSAPEFRRFSLLRAGFAPAGRNGLHCGYAGYQFKHLGTLSKIEFDILGRSIDSSKNQSKGKRDHLKFLKYLGKIYNWYFCIFILPSLITRGTDD